MKRNEKMKNQDPGIFYKIILSMLLGVVLFWVSCKSETEPDIGNRPAQVETLDVQDVGDVMAVCKGKISDKGTGTITQYGIELNDGNGYKKYPQTKASLDVFEVTFAGLTPEHTYHYRAYINDGTVQYGAEKNFTTLATLIYTVAISPEAITSNSAVVSFALTDHLREWGFHYSQTEVTVNDPVIKEFVNANITLPGLKRDTQYNILPYVKDKSGKTAYLEEISFTTSKVYAELTLADPYILLYDEMYYAYGTNSDNGIEVYVSRDLKEWRKQDRLALHKDDSFGNKWFWAPEVYYVNEKFYMYYSAEEHICVAIADSPLGPFRQPVKKPMFEGERAIDNSLFIDDNGKAYLFFDRFNDGLNIWVAELENDLMTIKAETLHPCIRVSQTWEQVWPRVNEGPFVIKHNGLYYMTYSANSYESQFYGIGCATATDIMGEWLKYPNNPLLQKPGDLVGVGHNSMFTDKQGDLRVVFHAHYNKDRIHPRKMYITKAGFNKIGDVDHLYIEKNYETPVLILEE